MRAENSPPCLLDSNIWLYAFVEQGEPQKQAAAKQLLEQPAAVVSTQIINEVCFNLLRKADFTEEQIRRLIYSFYLRYSVSASGTVWWWLPHYKQSAGYSIRKTCSTGCTSMNA